MTAYRARAEFDLQHLGVKIAVGQTVSETETRVLTWGTPVARMSERGEPINDDDWMRLDEDAARAIYEALADYFGGTGHDTRALRKDYDAERKRVDTFIAHLTSVTK